MGRARARAGEPPVGPGDDPNSPRTARPDSAPICALLSPLDRRARLCAVHHAQDKLLRYYDETSKLTLGIDDSTVLQSLPYELRCDVAYSMYRETLLRAPFFLSMSEECALQMLVKLKPQVCLADDVLVECGEPLDDIYFLTRGTLKVLGTDGVPSSGAGRSETRKSPRELCGDGGNTAEGGCALPGTLAHSKTMGHLAKSSKQLMGVGGKGSVLAIVERFGSVVGGMRLFGESILFPRRVVAVKKAVMLRIPAKTADAVLKIFPEADRAAATKHLQSEFEQLVALKGRADKRPAAQAARAEPPSPTSKAPARLMLPAVPETPALAVKPAESPAVPRVSKEEALDKVERVERGLANAMEQMRAVRNSLALLPEVIEVLQVAAVAKAAAAGDGAPPAAGCGADAAGDDDDADEGADVLYARRSSAF